MEAHQHLTACLGRGHCQDIYARLGNAKAPSVTLPALVAFAAPIFVFIDALLGFEFAMRHVIGSANIRMLAGFVPALMLAALVVLAIKVVTRRPLNSKLAVCISARRPTYKR